VHLADLDAPASARRPELSEQSARRRLAGAGALLLALRALTWPLSFGVLSPASGLVGYAVGNRWRAAGTALLWAEWAALVLCSVVAVATTFGDPGRSRVRATVRALTVALLGDAWLYLATLVVAAGFAVSFGGWLALGALGLVGVLNLVPVVVLRGVRTAA
jgi:hypothetical protein